jgi:hypothetical protein
VVQLSAGLWREFDRKDDYEKDESMLYSLAAGFGCDEIPYAADRMERCREYAAEIAELRRHGYAVVPCNDEPLFGSR